MLGKLRFTQNLEISTWPNDILGKGSIFGWFCVRLGIPSLFPDFLFSMVLAHCLSSNNCRLFHGIKSVSLFPVYEFCMSIEYG